MEKGAAGSKKEIGRLSESLPVKQKMTLKSAAGGNEAEKTDKMTYAAAPSRQSAPETAIDLTVHVEDTAKAVREVETTLAQVNARIIDKHYNEGGAIIKAEMASRNLARFIKNVRGIGIVEIKKGHPAVTEDKAVIIIKITGTP